MSGRWQGQELLLPISPDRPCGEDLEESESDRQLFASLDTYRLFGQAKPLDAPADKEGNWVENWIPKPPESPVWAEIRDKAVESLRKSKDLRVLAHLATALLRTDGVPAYCETLIIASQWLDTYWVEVYPRIDADDTEAVLRCSALRCFADPMAVVEALRRAPLTSSRQHGTFSLRDIDTATRQQPQSGGSAPADEKQIAAAFASMPLVDLTHLHDSVVGAGEALRKIDAKTREAAGSEAAVDFDALTAQLKRIGQVLRAQLASHPDNVAAAMSGVDGEDSSGGGGVSIGGGVKSRDDAVRALDAVADFFRRTEPSSPIPLFLERAKRLVSKDFLEVLADIAPEAVAQARAAGGLKEGE